VRNPLGFSFGDFVAFLQRVFPTSAARSGWNWIARIFNPLQRQADVKADSESPLLNPL
jgi:hypothetical protein